MNRVQMTKNGGMEAFSIVSLDSRRSAVLLGGKRLFDLVKQDGRLLAEYKPVKRDAVQGNPADLLRQLAEKLKLMD